MGSVARGAAARSAAKVAAPRVVSRRRTVTQANKTAVGVASACSTLLAASAASAAELNQAYGDLAADNRAGILLFIVGPAIGWTVFNSIQGLLGQFDRTKEASDNIAKKQKKFF